MTFASASRLPCWVLLSLAVWPGAVHAAPPALSVKDVAALKSACDDVVSRTTLAKAQAGILVTTLDGKVVYAHSANELLNPASNVKLFTSATALSTLGPAYRWETDFLTRDPIKPDGSIKDLYVRGNGDPLMTTERLYAIVSDLYHLGLRRITGTIYLDDSYFDGNRVGPGFDQEESDRAYMAPTGALSLNWNAVQINVFPGAAAGKPARVELEPPSDYFKVENHVTTVRPSDRGRVRLKLSTVGDRQKVEVSGRLPLDKPGVQLWRKIDQPTPYFGYTLKALLRQRGIKFYGRIRAANTPSSAKVFDVAESPPLALAVRHMNKVSSNFIAEMLVKTLGANLGGAPGSWAKGISAVEDFLATQVGIPRGSYVMKNGSGLNDTNRFSAAQVVKVLTYMAHQFGAGPEYMASLGIAGKDGTVHGRMEGTDAEGHIRAKTGTLHGVTALSGLVESVGGERFAFAILVNDYPGKHADVNAAMDDLGVTVAEAGGPVGSDATAKALVADATPRAGPLAELEAHMATYGSLAELHDKRNLPFLRTALRTERDPAVRVVVADALYQSAPGDAAGVRALLDAWSGSPDVLGRLQAAARAKGVAVPSVGSLLDLAAGGNAEALGHVVELAPKAQGDAPLTRTLTDGFDQIARNAPDELIAALHAAAPEPSRAAVALLVQGTAASTDPGENPFPKALAAAQTAKDPDLCAFAKQLLPAFTAQLADARAKLKAAPTTVQVGPASGKPATVTPVSAPAPSGG